MTNPLVDLLGSVSATIKRAREEEQLDRKKHPILWFFKDLKPYIILSLFSAILFVILTFSIYGFYCFVSGV